MFSPNRAAAVLQPLALSQCDRTPTCSQRYEYSKRRCSPRGNPKFTQSRGKTTEGRVGTRLGVAVQTHTPHMASMAALVAQEDGRNDWPWCGYSSFREDLGAVEFGDG